MCSARSGNGPTRVKTIDKQLKNESVKKEDAEFCGENLIGRKLNVCFIQWPSVVELSLIGHLTYQYIDGKYCDISICIDI